MRDENVSIPTVTRNDRVREELKFLPRVFRLRGFPGEYFRADEHDSYVSDGGAVTIYLHIRKGDQWTAHSKGSLREILGQLIEVSGDRKFSSDADVEAFLDQESGHDVRVRTCLQVGAASVDYISHITNLSHVDVIMALKRVGAVEQRGIWRMP